MLELKLGFMSTDELAQWASLSAAHMAKNKKAWCQKHLKNVIHDYHLCGDLALEIGSTRSRAYLVEMFVSPYNLLFLQDVARG